MGVYNGIKIQNKQEKYKKKDCPTFRTASILKNRNKNMKNGGYDYVFFSDRKVEEVLPKFKENIKSRWENPHIEDISYEDIVNLFFSKDEAMFEETGEFTNEMGEESFCFVSRQYRNFSASILVTEIDYEGKDMDRDEKYPVFAGFAYLQKYTLTLYESIEENEFYAFIYNALVKALSGI
jgi:hypothetical protein